MAVPKIFKTKKAQPTTPTPKDRIEGKEQVLKQDVAQKKNKEASSQLVSRVLIRPRVTEKAVALAEVNQYVFEVQDRASKHDIEQAIHELYGVDVQKVRMITIHSKPKRFGRHEGRKPGYKKAIVHLAKGQTIEVIPT